RQFPPLHVPPQRDQQLAGQRHDPHLPGPLVPRPEAPVVPLAPGTARLPAPPPPGQLHDQPADVFGARLADPLLPFPLPAVVGRRLQPPPPPQPLAVGDAAPAEQLRPQDPGPAPAPRLQAQPAPPLLQVRLLPLAQPALLLVGGVPSLPVQ